MSTDCLQGVVVVVVESDGRIGDGAALRCDVRRLRVGTRAFQTPACGSAPHPAPGASVLPVLLLRVKNRRRLGLRGMVRSGSSAKKSSSTERLHGLFQSCGRSYAHMVSPLCRALPARTPVFGQGGQRFTLHFTFWGGKGAWCLFYSVWEQSSVMWYTDAPQGRTS